MKTRIFSCFIIGLFIFSLNSYSQGYGKMRITLNDGSSLEGKKGTLTDESVSCLINGQLQSYSLEDVKLVTARKGNAVKWAAGTGGCCIAIFVVSGILDPEGQLEEEGMMGSYILGSALLTAVGAGIGYLVGSLADPWKNVYMSGYPAAFNRLRPVLNLDPEGRPLFGISYTF